MKADLREVRDAPDRANAEASIAVFVDFPAEHWDHLKTSNPTTVLRKS